ncbi:MAG: hypothetical protein AAF098_00090 [Pseudomonadota bacterium]
MADIKTFKLRDSSELEARRQAKRLAALEAVVPAVSARRAGFSARLNMLCSLAGERELNNGRLEDLATLADHWVASEVRDWLTDDSVPQAVDLDLLVRFLASRLSEVTDHRLWEAYLLFGTDYVPNPLYAATHLADQDAAKLATTLLLELTRDYRIPPHSYDAEEALHEMMLALQDLNISSSKETLQAGHKRMLAARVFGVHEPN